MSFHVVIPARMASTRLPGKVLRSLAGVPLLQHVYERAIESNALDVTIATDNAEVEAVAREFGAAVCMTSSSHESGTDRIHEVVTKLAWGADDIVVNLQGDEPGMPPALVGQVAQNLAANPWADIATLRFAIDSWEEWQDPGLVKVVADEHGQALYFSRAAIPFDRSAEMAEEKRLPLAGAWGHIGLYAYRVSALQRFSELPVGKLEECEALEQLRGMAYGLRIHVAEATQRPGVGVDTEADLKRAEMELLAQR